MGSHGNPQKQFISCPPLTDAKAPLLKITPTQFIEHREIEPVPPMTSIHNIEIVHTTMDKGSIHQPICKLSDLPWS